MRRRLLRVWQELRLILILVVGTLLGTLAYVLFQIPHNIAAGGLSGVGIIVNHFTGFSVAWFYFLANLPLFILGFFALGRWRFLIYTVISVVIFSAGTEILLLVLPDYLGPAPITDNVLLSAVYAGLVSGIGNGLIYIAGATMGGTAILGRILQLRTGTPLGTVYLYVDGVIVITAGIVFSWEIALYALLTLLLSGLAADYVLEGPSRTRMAMIITQKPDEMVQALLSQLGRGVSFWKATGGYTGEPRTVIMCTIYRPQVNDLKRIVNEIDPRAFVSVGIVQTTMGEGFARLGRP
jgi:uncharacterized membrane-anchored protein YitT (DUF2179 family)